MASKQIDSSDFKKVPVWFDTLNRIWRTSYPIGSKVSIDVDDLIKSARKQCRLHDLGSDFSEEPLRRLVESINGEAALHPIGRFITKKRLENLLSVRLRAERCFKKHPEILNQELYPATVILGLQRTGTTKLQRLLAADPDTRALLSWEALNPAPLKGDRTSGSERIKQAKLSEKALKLMSPGFFAIHPVEHLAPEEDVLLLDVSFMSTTAEATMRVPSYANWLETVDQSPSYAYMAKLMKLLQWQRPGKRWVLKTPHHLEFPHLVNDCLGDVEFVWTHRRVEECIPSFLSMLAYSRVLFSDQVVAIQIAEQWVRKIGFMLDTAIKFREKPENDKKFLDVNYKELVNDSSGVLKEIYAKRGQEPDRDLLELFAMAESESPKGKYGEHRYRLEDFGIDTDFILEKTASYRNFLEERKLSVH